MNQTPPGDGRSATVRAPDPGGASPSRAPPPERRGTSRLWHQPARAAAWTFALGTMASAGSLGIFATIVEGQAYLPADADAALKHGALLAAWVLAHAAVWGALMHAAVKTRDGKGGVILGAFSAIAFFVTLVILIGGGDHQGRPSLSPGFGMFFAVFLDAIRVVTFGPVRGLARRAQEGDEDPLTVASAGCAWAALISVYGILLAPGPYCAAPSILGLAASLGGLVHVYVLARSPGEIAPDPTMILRGLTMGGTFAVVMGLVLVPSRLYEQRVTRSPAVLAIYHHKQGRYGACDVQPAGREGDLSLWQLDCHGGWAPMVGWNERQHLVLDDEDLYQRLPQLRPPPSKPVR